VLLTLIWKMPLTLVMSLADLYYHQKFSVHLGRLAESPVVKNGMTWGELLPAKS